MATDSVPPKSHRILALTTLAFTVSFAVWMLNGVLVTYLSTNRVFEWSVVQVGWLIGIPVLTGSIFRLPAGVLTDRFGGRPVLTLTLLLCAVPMWMLSYAESFLGFALCSFGFGIIGVNFAIGIGYSALWYPKRLQGTALGIFGAGNAGAAGTTLLAPTLLHRLTDGGANLDGWRELPRGYALMMVVMAVVFFLLTENRKPAISDKSLKAVLAPLKDLRVWRFGLYYFLVFGCFVAFSQWLVPYFVNVYQASLVTAGLFAALFSFPSGVIRALGGWASDRFGARAVMYWVLGTSLVISLLLVVPKMDVYSPGQGVMAARDGVVTAVGDNAIEAGGVTYPLRPMPEMDYGDDETMVFPTKAMWQEAVVAPGDAIVRKQLLAKGVTRIHFQANLWIFGALAILLGIIWGIGKAAVYKHIPDYFPHQVGVVGGTVGVIGGLGGFACPILFGYLLEGTGLWTSCWMFMFLLSVICLVWMHVVILRMNAERAPEAVRKMERPHQQDHESTAAAAAE